MSHKTVLAIAAALTAFVLVVGGAVVGGVAYSRQTATANSTVDVNALVLEREAQYRALIDQANAQLADAYRSNSQSLTSQDAMLQTTTEQISTWITPEEAMSAAVISIPGAQVLQFPELVDFQGTVAYEVHLDSGTVYINASNGALIYDGTSQQSVANNQPTVTRSRQYHDDDFGEEYEHGGDD